MDLYPNCTSNTYSITIGYRGINNDGFFNGSVDEIKIYGYALTPEQILIDMNRGSTQVLGSMSTSNATSDSKLAGSQEYCVPGDSTSCSGPTVEWRFDEKVGSNARDTSGNSLDGILQTGASGNITTTQMWKSGKQGSSVSLDGTDDYISTSYAGVTGNAARTYEAWVKTSAPGSFNSILTYGTEASGQRIEWSIVGATIGMYASGTNIVYTATNLNNNQWHHLVFTLPSTSNLNGAKFFMDGIQLTSVASSVSPTTSINTGTTNTVRIGRYFDGTDSFGGQLDTLRIFDYVRTPAQIVWDYNRGGPIGWWKMDECQGTTINDSSGNALSGTWSGSSGGSQTSVGTCSTSATAWGNGAAGKFNSSLYFDGTNDYVDMGNPTALQFARTDSFSISGWIKTTATGIRRIVGKLGGSPFPGYSFLLDGGTPNHLSLQILNTSASNELLVHGNTGLNDGNWHHVVATYNGSSLPSGIQLFVDGKLEILTTDTNTLSGSIATSSQFEIGRCGSGCAVDSQDWNGQIDDIRVYNYGLTSTQVKDIYTGGSVRYGPVTGSP